MNFGKNLNAIFFTSFYPSSERWKHLEDYSLGSLLRPCRDELPGMYVIKWFSHTQVLVEELLVRDQPGFPEVRVQMFPT